MSYMVMTEIKAIKGAKLLFGVVHEDHRGTFTETHKDSDMKTFGLPERFVQSNVSISKKGVIRGLHAQKVNPQGKLIRCLSGKILDVIVDARPDSPTFGAIFQQHLGGDKTRDLAIYAPPGCLHGFCAIEDNSTVLYHCTTEYDPVSDGGVSPFDPRLNIQWPVNPELVSAKDLRLSSWVDYVHSLK